MTKPIKTYYNRLSVKELIVFSILFFVGVVYIIYGYESELKQKSDSVLQLALSVESNLPVSEIEALQTEPLNFAGKSFPLLRRALQRAIKATPNVRFAYVYIERSGNLYFIADSEPESSPDYSPSGQEFTEADPVDKLSFSTKKAQVTDPVSDRWGRWVSAEVPIFDSQTGNVIAVLGMDYNAKSWRANVLFRVFQSVVFVVIVFVLILFIRLGGRKNAQLEDEIRRRGKIESILCENQTALANLVSNLPGFIYKCSLDRDYTMEFISDTCLRLTGYSADDFTTNKKISFNELILPQYRDYIWEKWQRVLREGSVFEEEYQIKTASGEIKWLWERGKCIFDDQNKLRYLEGYIEDISLRKKAEDELRKLSLAIEQNPASVIISNSSGIIEYVNPRFSEMTGYKASEIIGQSPRVLKSGKMGDEFYAELLGTIYSGKIWKGEVINKNKKGEMFWVSQSISPITDQNNQITHFVAIEEDISEKKKIEQELILAKEKAEESARLKSAFLANISHEIRTPMNGILGFAELLRNGSDMSSEEGLDYLGLIFQSSKRLLEMLNNLIDISKIQAGEKTIRHSDVNLNVLMHNLFIGFSSKAKEKNLQLKLNIQDKKDSPSFISDREKLEKTFICLLDNACKFTNKGIVEFGYIVDNAVLQFFVKDTGIGIPEEKKSEVFEIFRQGSNDLTRQYEGAGLGLTIAKTYAEWLGGKIVLDSEVGRGTLITVELPFVRNEKIEALPIKKDISSKEQNIHLLIADDDATSRIFLEKSLKNHVASVVVAKNGREVVEIVRLNPQVNLVLMDLKMPVLDGFEATKLIKLERPEIHVVAQTAFDELDDQKLAVDSGCTEIITKPININVLRATIARLIPVLILFILAACQLPSPVNEKPVAHPQAFEDKGTVEPDNRVKAPTITPALKPSIFSIGKLPVKVSETNIYKAGNPVLLPVVGSQICIPGSELFSKPTVSRAVIQKKLCKEPEIVMARDPLSKERNPENFVSYSKLQGLKHDQVRGMTQDSFGNMWFATDEGLTRFDGKFFSHYSTNQGLTNSLILSVFQDSKSNMWIGTFRGGVTLYDGCYLANFTQGNGFPNDVVNCITEDLKGNIWFGTGGGIVKFDGTEFTNYTEKQGLCNNDVRHIFVDKDNKLWISTNKGGFSVFDGTAFTNYSQERGLGTNVINCIAVDKNNNYWLASPNNGLIKYDGKSFYSYSKNEGLSANELSCVIAGSDGNLWIGTMNKGIMKFDGNNFTYYTEDEGVSSNVVRCALADKSGKLWFGTRGGGVVRFEGETFNHLTEEQGLSSSRVTKITVDKDRNIWLGTNGGYVTQVIKKKVDGNLRLFTTNWGTNQGILSSRVYEIMEDRDGNIWFGSEGGGVACYNGKNVKVYNRTTGLQSSSVRRIIQDKKGNYWIGTYGSGLSYFDGSSFVKYTIAEGLINDNIQSLLEDNDGKIWIGTDVGACCFDGKRFTHYKKANGLSDYPIYSIKNDSRGNIWFGTGGDGAICYNGKTFTHYTTVDGLNSDFVLSIMEDSAHNMWFGTRSGPSVLDMSALETKSKSPARQILFQNYDYEDGFLGIGCNSEALNENPDGEIWIGANDRLSVFRGKLLQKDTIRPVVAITKVNLFNEDISWDELFGKDDTTFVLNNGIKINDLRFDRIMPWYNIPENPSFSYSNNYLTFNFIGISQSQNKRLRFQVKLEGLDKDWGSPSKRNEASYGNLPAGKYTLKIKAVNSQGVWSKEISYPFVIRNPWWKSWWFYLFLIGFFSGSFYLFIQYRVRKIRNDKIMLQEKVDEQTIELTQKNEDIRLKNKELQISNAEKDRLFSIIAHDIRGPLGTFIPLTELLADEIDTMTRQDLIPLAKSMNTSAKSLYDLLTNLLEWSRMQRGTMQYNPRVIQLNELVDKCVAVVINIAENKNISINYSLSADITIFADEYMMASTIRNLLTNAIKFTPRGGTVMVKAQAISDFETELTVSDNGIGIPENLMANLFNLSNGTGRYGTDGEPSTGLGLNLCHDFVCRNDGSIQAFSEVNRGTTFTVRLKSKPVNN